ncbi:MAG: hypothetical protein PHX04_06645 [Bacilli bacterium]|nr:hypothetical protein [Bacilli bacterium]
MKENKEIAKHVYKNSEMASYTLKTLLKELEGKDNKIKNTVIEINNEYQDYLNKSKKLLHKEKQSCPKNNLLNKMGAKMGINKEVTSDNSDSSIASMLIKGISTGIIDTSKILKDNKNISDKKEIKLATDFLKFQEKYSEELKKYL